MRLIRNSISSFAQQRGTVRSTNSAHCSCFGGLPRKQLRFQQLLMAIPQRSSMNLASKVIEEPIGSSEIVDRARSHRKGLTQVHSSLAHGCIDYVRGWAWQNLLLYRRLLARRSEQTDEALLAAEDPDIVMLLEHHSVYTLGRGANENHLTCLLNGSTDDQHELRKRLSRSFRGPDAARLSVDRSLLEEDLLRRGETETLDVLCRNAHPVTAPNGAPIYRVERGGEVTYHGPGQLVVYPLLDLKRHNADLHWFLRMVEEVIILTLKEYDIDGVRDEINTGVWVGKRKVASVGVSSSRWITTHGFAVNVNPDLAFFDASVIVPCGVQGRTVTSIAEILQERGETSTLPKVLDTSSIVVDKLREVFDLDIEANCRAIL